MIRLLTEQTNTINPDSYLGHTSYKPDRRTT
jgi:hypothetical protein